MKHKTLIRDSALLALAMFLGLGVVACEHDCDSCGHDVPATPRDVAAELFMSGVHLTWEDASNDEDNFVVERWARSAATAQDGGLAELVTLPENTEEYFDEDVDVDGGLTYVYRIKAVNDAGSSTSDEVEITVP